MFMNLKYFLFFEMFAICNTLLLQKYLILLNKSIVWSHGFDFYIVYVTVYDNNFFKTLYTRNTIKGITTCTNISKIPYT